MSGDPNLPSFHQKDLISVSLLLSIYATSVEDLLATDYKGACGVRSIKAFCKRVVLCTFHYGILSVESGLFRFLSGIPWRRCLPAAKLRTLRMCAVQTFFRSFLRHPQLVFSTALIKLIFLSAFLTVSSTCGLNDSDLSNVRPKIWRYGFLSNFMEGSQFNSEGCWLSLRSLISWTHTM